MNTEKNPKVVERIPRQSRASRGYEALRAESHKLNTLYSSDLERIARAICPELTNRDLKLGIFDAYFWPETGLCELEEMARETIYGFFRMKTRLVYFRQEIRYESSGKIVHDVRLTAFFNWRGTTIFLDAETGLPWRPLAQMKIRKNLGARRRQELEQIDLDATQIARRALTQAVKEAA